MKLEGGWTKSAVIYDSVSTTNDLSTSYASFYGLVLDSKSHENFLLERCMD